MDSYDCPHGMGKASSCILCMDLGPVEKPKEKIKAQFWLTAAQFASVCPLCENGINEGEPIGKTPDGWCCCRCVEP